MLTLNELIFYWQLCDDAQPFEEGGLSNGQFFQEYGSMNGFITELENKLVRYKMSNHEFPIKEGVTSR